MNRCAYRIRYEKKPPRAGREPFGNAELAAALSAFPDTLRGHLVLGGPNPTVGDLNGATVSVMPFQNDRQEIVVVVVTPMGLDKVDAAAQTAAKIHDLTATRIQRP